MKAAVLRETGGPDSYRIEEVPLPEPGAGEVRVRVHASALNRRDFWMTQGRYPAMRLPTTPGSDGAGVVDAVGSGVNERQIGREVVIYPARAWGDREDAYGPQFRVLGMPDQGTFAEAICVPATDVLDKPSHLSWDEAAAIPLAGLTSWRAVITHGEVKSGMKVLVTGAGSGTASFAIQWALQHGAQVFVSTGTAEKLAAAKAAGAAGGVLYTQPDGYSQLKKEAGGFDLIIDSAGGEALNAVLDTLRPAGRYVFYGATMGNPKQGLEMAKLFFKHARIQGTTMGSPREFNAMMNLVAARKLKPVVHKVYKLDQIAAALTLMQQFGQTGKIVLNHGA
jgi:zinc-binding alcohol dehydrogenase/oxidoreductase